jgi:uncharacterized radical SAM superfamily Fe-S cluster-containing enzyme
VTITATAVRAAKALSRTTSLCIACKQGIPAEIVELEGKIIMRKRCPRHGPQQVMLSSDAAWYHRTLAFGAVLKPPRHVKNEVKTGCPYDCGACKSHQQSVYLPVIPITSACNLDCPICYTINKNEDAFHMSLDEFARTLEVIRRNDPDMKIINLTGGEPTRHPQLTRIVRLCHEAGIHRVTISTHGLTFLHDEAMLQELAGLRARMVLSFDSFDDKVNMRMIGANCFSAKMRVLDQFAKHNVDTTLIPVIALGVNDHELGRLIRLVLERDNIRSLEIHTMTFTGQGGSGFDARSRITAPDVLRAIEAATEASIRMDDFVPSPCAHPLCYQTCYLLETKGGDAGRRFVPFARFMSKESIRELLTDNLYIEPGEKMERVLQGVIGDLWAMEVPTDTATEVLATLKRLIQDLFPSRPLPYAEQQIRAERASKAIYLHSHMDEGNFDTDRIRQCCVGVPSADGGNIPTCSYNILYRARDARFSAVPQQPLAEFPGGRKEW